MYYRMPPPINNEPALKLHVYDHCPYCIRVELALGWQNIPYERIVYGYGNQLGDTTKQGCYSTGVVLTGKKELPVLEHLSLTRHTNNTEGTDEAGEVVVRDWLKAESLDIIAWVQRQQGSIERSIKHVSNNPKLKQFFDTQGRFKIVQRILSRPRYQKMTFLQDWKKAEDRLYAKTKYEKGGFDYAAAAMVDRDSIEEMNKLLQEFETQFFPVSSNPTTLVSLYPDGRLGYDDLLYLPELRTVTLVASVVWPARLKEYVLSAHGRANVETYFHHQVE